MTGMTHLKIINASQGPIHKYKDLKSKLYKYNTNIYFNKQCLRKQLTPSYANIKVPNTSHSTQIRTAQDTRDKNNTVMFECMCNTQKFCVIEPAQTGMTHLKIIAGSNLQ